MAASQKAMEKGRLGTVATYRLPFRSHPVLPVDGRGYAISVLSEPHEIHHEFREPTFRRALDTAQWLRFEFPSRRVVISDYRHIWLLSELEQP
jgi:hypothetical protein